MRAARPTSLEGVSGKNVVDEGLKGEATLVPGHWYSPVPVTCSKVETFCLAKVQLRRRQPRLAHQLLGQSGSLVLGVGTAVSYCTALMQIVVVL